jgi:hypothetical protein
MNHRYRYLKVYLSFVSLACLLALVLDPLPAFATTAATPSGAQVIDGWYKDSASISFNWQHTAQPGDSYIGVCAYGVQWNGYSPAGITYDFTKSGQHAYVFLTNSRGDIYVSIDSGPAQAVIAVCQNQTAMYPPDPGSVLWQGSISLDNTWPSVSIASLANDSNVTAATATVSGVASDADSGIAKVLVNGQQAAIAGNSFSVSVPVSQGLNTISAVAYDEVGHSTTSNSILVYGSAATPASPPTDHPVASATNAGNTAAHHAGASSLPGSMPSPTPDATIAVNSTDPKRINSKTAALIATNEPRASRANIGMWAVMGALVVGGLGTSSIKFGWHNRVAQKLKRTRASGVHIPSVRDHLFHKVATTDSEKCRPLSAQSRDQGEPPVAG